MKKANTSNYVYIKTNSNTTLKVNSLFTMGLMFSIVQVLEVSNSTVGTHAIITQCIS